MASAECSAEDCNRLVFEAVNRKSVYKFELVKRTYSQIEVLASLCQCNEKGETPLVIAMKGGNVSLIDELVIFLRKCDREVAKCHEMSQIAIDQLFYHLIPIMELLEHLIKKSNDSILVYSKWLDFFAKVAFKATSLSRQDKIIALELIGASLCNHDRYDEEDSNHFAVMFRCWREAMTLRYFPAEGEPLLPKIPYMGVQSVASSVVFGSAVEVMTMDELDLLQDVEVQKTLIQRQCLLVIRRISSQANHGHPYSVYLQNLYCFGFRKLEDCLDYGVDNIVRYTGNSRIAINTFLLILEQFDPNLLPRHSIDVFIKTLGFASRFLALLAMEPPGNPGREEPEELSYNNLLALTKFIGTIAICFPNPTMMTAIKFVGPSYRDFDELIHVILMSETMHSFADDSYDGFAEIVSNLVLVLVYISSQLNNQEVQQIEEHLSNYIRNYFPQRTTSVLHAGVRGLLKFRTSDNLRPITRMTMLGADPNAIDVNGKTPLHILAEIEDLNSNEYLPIFQALVAAGAHLDMAADNGDTVLDILQRNTKIFNNRDVAAYAYFISLIHNVH